jgi:hypothetical protein
MGPPVQLDKYICNCSGDTFHQIVEEVPVMYVDSHDGNAQELVYIVDLRLLGVRISI